MNTLIVAGLILLIAIVGSIILKYQDRKIAKQDWFVSLNCININRTQNWVLFLYIFGASLKDAGKKLSAYIKMQETLATDLLNNIR